MPFGVHVSTINNFEKQSTLNMDHSDQLAHIEKLMQRSTRFISLSGLSGVGAGIIALVGAFVANQLVSSTEREHSHYASPDSTTHLITSELILKLGIIAVAVLLLCAVVAFYFSHKRAKKIGASMFDQSGLHLLGAFFPAMIIGGVFCGILLFYEMYVVIVPTTLLFYGLALVNASKFTLDEIFYLGISEIILGAVCAFLPEYAYYFWSLGFGVLHIAYGISMYFKYEKK